MAAAIKGVTHAPKTCIRETCARNLQRSAIQYKFLVPETFKRSRPIKLHNFGHMRQCKFFFLYKHRHTSQGAGVAAAHHADTDKSIIFREKLSFSGRSQQPKMKKKMFLCIY